MQSTLVRPVPARTDDNALKMRGFTLIEVLIVVAIIGILAAIAYPSYGSYVTKTRRTDAHFALLNQRQAMERCRSTTYTYVGCTIKTTTEDQNYTLALSNQTATTFTLTATPVTGKPQAGDSDCSSMTIDHLDRPLPAACWE